MAYTSGLVSSLRRRIGDTGTVVREFFVGDGYTDVFYLPRYPIVENSEIITFDKVPISSGAYTMDDSTGVLTLTGAPSNGVSIEVVYMCYDYSDSELKDFISSAVIKLASSIGEEFTCDGETITPDLTFKQETLVLLFAVRDLYTNSALRVSPVTMSWSDGEKRVDKSKIVGNIADAIKLLDEQIDTLVAEINNDSITGYKLSGGTEPIGWGYIDWEELEGS